MSLENMISCSNKEIVGSRTKNRLTVQISYALQLIMEFYPTDFIILMDYIEDVVVITDPYCSSQIRLYQIKTKSSDKQYLLSAVIKDQWFQKLYTNAQTYHDYLKCASLVCNTDIVNSGKKEVFPNTVTSLDDNTIQKNIEKIRNAIALDQGIKEDAVDLSKFFFIRSGLSTKNHKDEVTYQFGEFLLEKNDNIQVATVKAIYSVLYNDLDSKFNHEISESCSDINEIYSQKGLSSSKIKEIIACGLAIQMPNAEKLFHEFQISSISDRRKYITAYRQIKMDMYSNTFIFIDFQERITKTIGAINDSGIDDMPALLYAVHDQIASEGNIPTGYDDDHYLNLLIMLLIYKYCYEESS